MRIVVIGGTGHIGTYLVPELVQRGHEVIVLSRGERTPYQDSGAWRQVELQQADRNAEDAAGTFGQRVRDLQADVVIDLICFTEDSARQLAEALRGEVAHLLHCGTIWVHGPSAVVPTKEDAPRTPFGDYGIQKAAIERYLLTEAPSCPRQSSIPGTSAALAGHRSTRPATSISAPSRSLPTAPNSPCPTSAWRPFSTSMRPMSRACSSPRWRTGPSRSARASTRSPTAR